MASETDKKMLDDFFQNRELMIRSITEIANELDEVHKNVKITKVVTGSAGIAGTILCIIGLALAVPTAGVSIALTLSGGILAATSGAAHLGSDITEHLITKNRLNKFNELCQTDEANVLKLQNFLQKENEKLQNNTTESIVRGTLSSVAEEISIIGGLTCSIVRISQAATLTVDTIKIIGTVGIVLNAIILPVQVIDLTANGIALHNKQTSETSVKLRQLATKLQLQIHNIKKFIEDQQLLTLVK